MEKTLRENALRDAFKLFIAETTGHLAFLKTTLADGCSDTEYFASCTSHAKQFEHRFHTIKGGAGFLALKAIHEAADGAEKLFKKGCLAIEDQAELRRLLSGYIAVIEREISALKPN